ncbi:hypothetical protein MMG00_12780 [Ignatzschineria rhizosphaerae]|uniref:Ribbon-helix-helix protein CopG domain-containing protein n=1 Tax=Ignatzschineria rhizosphaerae TaxID=2923279 RepID=A0ABY3WZL2_9GAMM|nr:hypothetical protein [Ignatzschineria rhizosphaerae]UNM96056.1 hypothetical protein MMG00_12780 [Ignatzschineria rhizosphaerae]
MGKNDTNDKLVPFSVMMEPEKVNELKELAKNDHRSASAQARIFIESGLLDARRSSK